jgi:hypothetical protein
MSLRGTNFITCSSSAFMSSIHSAHNGLTELQGHNQILTEKACGNCAHMPSIQEFSRWDISSNVNNLPSIVQGRDSSVGIVTGYELHNRGIGDSFPRGVTVLYSAATRPICNQCVTGVLSPVVTAVTIKDAVLWDVVPCESCNNRRFGGTCRLHLQGRKIRRLLQDPTRRYVAGNGVHQFNFSSAKFLPTFADRGCRAVSAADPTAVLSVFWTGTATFSLK